MISAHRIEVVLTEDGKLSLDHLPFRTGQAVEVIVLAASNNVTCSAAVRGAVQKFDRPTDPVAENDWGVLQ